MGLARALVPQLALAVGYLGLRLTWLPIRVGVLDEPRLDVAQRLLITLETVGRALGSSVWPYPQRAQHGLLALQENGSLSFDSGYLALGMTALVATTGILSACWRHRAVWLAVLLTSVAFLPTSNLFTPWLQSCLFFERYLLLPHLGGAWCIALVVARLERVSNTHWQSGLRIWGIGCLALAVAFSGVRLWLRAEDYADANRFWRHEFTANPRSAVAPSQLGALASSTTERLHWFRQCHDNAAARGQFDDADHCLIATTETLLNGLLDGQVAELSRLEGQLAALLRGTAGEEATAVTHTIKLALPHSGTRRARILSHHPGRIESALAILHSRLGHPDVAVRFADESLSRCETCPWSLPLAAVFAAAGQQDRAAEILRRQPSGSVDLERISQQVERARAYAERATSEAYPARIHARAQSYLSLGRYGLAFATLLPEEAAILEVEPVARDYALIACRAGHDDVARRALLRHEPAARVDAIISAWRAEQPRLE
jgi:hypothetical protein